VIRRRQRRSAANPGVADQRGRSCGRAEQDRKLPSVPALPVNGAPPPLPVASLSQIAMLVPRSRLGMYGIHLFFVSSLSAGIRSARGVGDLTDELFENVFECNQASGLAVLVDQASEV
jgi:hypothetical protein